jgi:hypothetical protein
MFLGFWFFPKKQNTLPARNREHKSHGATGKRAARPVQKLATTDFAPFPLQIKTQITWVGSAERRRAIARRKRVKT